MTVVTTLPQTEAQRELCELNALHLEQALLQARIDAALLRLLDTDAAMRIPRIAVHMSREVDRAALLPGTVMHALHEQWLGKFKKSILTAHPADSCNTVWCDDKARAAVDPEFTFTFRGVWIFAGWIDEDAVIVREEVTA